MMYGSEDMDIIIRNNTDKPIYEQIREQIKEQILSGELKAGEALPSMRLLAKELRISMITTKRAYEELERGGYIESYTGRGSFVKGINTQMAKETVLCEIEELFEKALGKAKLVDLSYEDLQKMLKTMHESEEK